MRVVLIVALLMQEPDLSRDYQALYGPGSELAMITLIATFPDGSPARGFIRCAGNWHKHADEDVVLAGPELPFQVDGRGAIVMNPHVDDDYVECWCQERGYYGRVRVTFSRQEPTQIGHIRMRRES